MYLEYERCNFFKEIRKHYALSVIIDGSLFLIHFRTLEYKWELKIMLYVLVIDMYVDNH